MYKEVIEAIKVFRSISEKELRTLGEIEYDEYEFDYRYHKRMLENIDECRSLK